MSSSTDPYVIPAGSWPRDASAPPMHAIPYLEMTERLRAMHLAASQLLGCDAPNHPWENCEGFCLLHIQGVCHTTYVVLVPGTNRQTDSFLVVDLTEGGPRLGAAHSDPVMSWGDALLAAVRMTILSDAEIAETLAPFQLHALRATKFGLPASPLSPRRFLPTPEPRTPLAHQHPGMSIPAPAYGATNESVLSLAQFGANAVSAHLDAGDVRVTIPQQSSNGMTRFMIEIREPGSAVWSHFAVDAIPFQGASELARTILTDSDEADALRDDSVSGLCRDVMRAIEETVWETGEMLSNSGAFNNAHGGTIYGFATVERNDVIIAVRET